MPRKALKTSPALARTLRSRRRELGFTLREVVRQTERAGNPIPFSTLAKIEQGRVDPGIRRLHLLLKLYHLPIQMAGDVLDLEEMADERPATRDPETLYREGVAAWKRGETKRGLAHLLALREVVGERPEGRLLRQRSQLAFAIASGSLGRYRMALQIVEGLLLDPIEPELRIAAYVQAASAWDGLGAPDVALAFLERAARQLDAADHQQRGWVLHKTAGVLCGLGQLERARAELDAALASYRAAQDDYGESRVLGLRVRLHETAGDLGAALRAAREAHEHAAARGYTRLALLRKLQQGRLLVALGDSETGLSELHHALADALTIEDRAAQFFAHYHLWKAHVQLGERDRARIERRAAEYFVQFVDDASEEVLEIRRGGRERGTGDV